MKDGKFLVHFPHKSSHAHSQKHPWKLHCFIQRHSLLPFPTAAAAKMGICTLHRMARKQGCVLDYRSAGLCNPSKCSGRIRDDQLGLVITLPQNIDSSTSNLDIASCKGTKLQVDYEQPEIDHRLELRRQKRLCEMCQNYETCMLLMCLEATCLRLLRRWWDEQVKTTKTMRLQWTLFCLESGHLLKTLTKLRHYPRRREGWSSPTKGNIEAAYKIL